MAEVQSHMGSCGIAPGVSVIVVMGQGARGQEAD